MKVIILRTVNSSLDLTKKTYDVLNGISGKIEFELIENKGYSLRDISSHDEIFRVCTDFRKKQNVNTESFVVLLTQTSYNNWFSAFDGKKNIYVHTDEWERYTEVPAEYSIAYSIAENILQTLMGLDINNIDWKYIHREPIACVNDFCGDKRTIIHKIQSADICPTCLEKIKSDSIDKSVLRHLVTIFEGVRKVFKNYKYGFEDEINDEDLPIRYELELDRYGIYVKKVGNDQKEFKIDLGPAELTFYVFLLLHKNGIRKNDINSKEIDLLTRLYSIYSNGRLDRNPFLRLINETTSARDQFAQYRSHTNKKIKLRKLGVEYQILYNEKRNRVTFDRLLLTCEDERIINLVKTARIIGLNVTLKE